MAMSGITWNSQYLATRDGILMSVQVGTGLLGGLVAAGLGAQLEAFIYWMTFLVSGIFLISFSSSLIQILEEKIPYFYKIVISLKFVRQYPILILSSISSIFVFGLSFLSSTSYTDSFTGI